MFAIARISKVSSLKEARVASAHNMRTDARFSKEVDQSRSHLNQVLVGSQNAFEDIKQALPEKRRKNAVLAVEVLLTASPEYFRDANMGHGEYNEDKLNEWISPALEFAQKHFGDNLVNCALHLDEATPHLQMFVVPKREDGKLDARSMFDRTALIKMQDAYHASVKHLGLDRGVSAELTKREHEPVKEYYARTKTPSPSKKVKKPAKIDRASHLTSKKVTVSTAELDTLEENFEKVIDLYNDLSITNNALIKENEHIKNVYNDNNYLVQERQKEIKELKDELEQKSPITLHELTTAIALNKEENEIMNKAVKNKELYFASKNEFEYNEVNYKSPIDFLIRVFKHTVESALVKLTTLFNRERVVNTFLEREREGVERMLNTQITLQKNAQNAEQKDEPTANKKLETEAKIWEQNVEQKPTNFGPSFG
jgi:hypothetical protein